MSASRLWSSGGLVSMLVPSLILLLCSICQSSLASSTVKYGRSGHFGGKLTNLKDSVCDPLISGDNTRCINEAGQKFPSSSQENVCKWGFYVATCLTPAACQKCPGDSLLIWIRDQQDKLDTMIGSIGTCGQWKDSCPHLSCPTTPTPTVPNTTTPMATTEELITPKAPFPYWVIGVVALVLLLLVGGFLCWKYVFKSSSHKAKHSHGSSGPKRGASSSGLKKGSFSSGHPPSPKKPSSAHKKSTTGGHHQSSHHHQSSNHHQAAAKRGGGGHSSSTVAQHVPTKIGPKLVRPKTIKIKHISGKNSLEVVKQQVNSVKSNELIILDFRKSIKWQ